MSMYGIAPQLAGQLPEPSTPPGAEWVSSRPLPALGIYDGKVSVTIRNEESLMTPDEFVAWIERAITVAGFAQVRRMVPVSNVNAIVELTTIFAGLLGAHEEAEFWHEGNQCRACRLCNWESGGFVVDALSDAWIEAPHEAYVLAVRVLA